MDRTRRTWILRIEFLIGVGAVALGVLAYGFMPADVFSEPSPRGNLLVVAGLVGLAVGFIWMIRVLRGSRTR